MTTIHDAVVGGVEDLRLDARFPELAKIEVSTGRLLYRGRTMAGIAFCVGLAILFDGSLVNRANIVAGKYRKYPSTSDPYEH
ncbi:MAG: hypothetical protein Q8O52_26880 [Sulfuritalea sp.]|nr:hypothetical protein [Sulfuritalea sp.]